jgi:energy-coupling factor transporter transmembrane protein EcfT
MIEMVMRWLMIDKGYSVSQFHYLAFIVAGLFFLVMGFIQFYRYNLWIYLVIGFFAGVGCILAIYIVPGFPVIFKVVYTANMLIILLIVIINWPLLSSQERFEGNARRLFKLASELVTETSNGYTHRPFAAGKITINKDELLGFARFVNGKFIARSIHLKDSVYLIFSMNKSVMNLIEPTDVSYFEISEGGEVSVRISEKDYLLYKATFNFDQLNEKMASVLIRFIDYYKDGNENRILTELKTAR